MLVLYGQFQIRRVCFFEQRTQSPPNTISIGSFNLVDKFRYLLFYCKHSPVHSHLYKEAKEYWNAKQRTSSVTYERCFANSLYNSRRSGG
jgi:hypothetical protein